MKKFTSFHFTNQKVIGSLLIIILSIKCLAQNWAPTGATWYYSNGESIFNQDQGYFKIESKGDTVIMSKTCKKLLVTKVDHNNNSFIYGLEIMYSSGDTIFRLSDNNQFYVLYNFSAQPGDTWIVRSYDQYLGYDTSATIQLDSVSSTVINSQSLKTLYTTTINGYLHFGYPIVEKLGDTKFWMFPGDWGMWDFDIRGGLRCYQDSTFGFYNSNISPSCNYLLLSAGIGELSLQDLDIEVFPNPFNSTLFVNTDSFNQSALIEIFTCVGKKICSEIVNPHINKINVQFIEDGIYLLQITKKNGSRTFKKIIKTFE